MAAKIGIIAIATLSLFGLPGFAAAAEPSCVGVGESDRGFMYYDVFLIFFDRNSATITDQAASTLENVATVYRPLSHCQLNVAAHTDRVGSDAYNLALSEQRARAVVAHLRHLGVRASPHIESLGETRPLVETADGVEERQNRRAEIIISPRGRSTLSPE